jgi:hypothetical protein
MELSGEKNIPSPVLDTFLVRHVIVHKLGVQTLRENVCYLLRQKMEEAYHKSVSSYVDIAKQATTDLQTLSQHSIELATNLLSIGGDKYGIFSAHLVELMHCFLGGIAKYAICAY